MLKWLMISTVVFFFDLISKNMVVSSLAPMQHVNITSFFDLVLFYNQGAAFSFLADAGGWQKYFFSFMAIFASIVILVLISKHSGQKLFCLALSLVLGGALGNLHDRVMLGHVVDFLLFYYKDYYWPAFNLADSSICVGVALLLYDNMNKKLPQEI